MNNKLHDFLENNHVTSTCNNENLKLMNSLNLNIPLMEILNRISVNKKLVLFGAGLNCLDVIKFLSDNGFTVDYICDNYKKTNNNLWGGISLITFADLCQIRNEVEVIITSVAYIQILKQLIENSFSIQLIGVIDSINLLNRNLFYENNIDSILELYELLSDSESKNVLINILHYRLTGNHRYILEIARPTNLQYFDKDLINLTSSEVFIDGGAFDGDTLKQFINFTNNQFNGILSFEPDYESYNRLSQYVNLQKDSRIQTYNLGLYKESRKLYFDGGNGVASNITELGNISIDTVNLDSFADKNITYIKMDIEGAEMDALTGCANIIIKNKPKLAICAYHKPEDLWEIPLFIEKLNPLYNIFMRHYANTGSETVCYGL